MVTTPQWLLLQFNKIFLTMKKLFKIISLLILFSIHSVAQNELAGWDFNGLSNYGNSPMLPTTTNQHISVGGLTRGSGVSTSGGFIIQNNSFGGSGFLTPGNRNNAITSNDYLSFSITTKTNHITSLSSIGSYNIFVSEEIKVWFDFFYLSYNGPIRVIWQYQVGSGLFHNIGNNINLTRGGTGNPLPSIDLSGYSDLQNIAENTKITFRLVIWYAGSEYGGLSLYDPEADSANDFTVNGLICPITTTWTGSMNTDWLNNENWSDGVPCDITQVIISSPTIAMNYPVITSSVICKNIIFEPNAGVLGLENLAYEKAFIKLTLDRDKFYCLTPPLKEMYSGDYYFNGSPETNMKFFDVENVDKVGPTIIYEGTFTRSFSSLTEQLFKTHGFAFKINKKTWNYPNGYFGVTTEKTIDFPRLNSDSSLVVNYVPYNGVNGKPFPILAKLVIKNEEKAYRFIAENNNNQLVNQTFNVETGLSLIGNPIMSHLNINSFINSNSSVIDNNIKLWDGTSYQTYDASTGLWDGVYVGEYIAPMQSFIVNSTYGGNINFDLSTHFGIPDIGSGLRSIKIKNNYLKILAIKDGVTTGTMIVKEDKAKNNLDDYDISKLFTNFRGIADVYTVSGNKVLAFNKFSEYPFITPLGIRTATKSKIKLNFIGAENFEDVDVFLINSKSGEEINLKECNVYEINTENNLGDLFINFKKPLIEIAPIEVALIENINNDTITIIGGDKFITVKSKENNKIINLKIYNLTGGLIKEIDQINRDFVVVNDLKTGVYLVGVSYENMCVKKKVFVH